MRPGQAMAAVTPGWASGRRRREWRVTHLVVEAALLEESELHVDQALGPGQG